jgi:hypothetical protein
MVVIVHPTRASTRDDLPCAVSRVARYARRLPRLLYLARVSALATTILAAWAARADTLSPEIGTDAPILGPAQAAPWNPGIATDGGGMLVVWEDYRLGGGDLFAARVDRAGTLLDPVGVPVALGTTIRQGGPKVAFDGAGFWIAWVEQTLPAQVVLSRWSGSGLVDDPPIPVHSGQGAALGCRSDGCIVVWDEALAAPQTGSRIAFSRVSPAGAILDPAGVTVAGSGVRRAGAALVATSDGYLVTWTQCSDALPNCDAGPNWSASDTDVYVARISGTGAVLDPGGIAVASGPGGQRAPALAWSGSVALVAWQEDQVDPYVPSSVRARRLSPDGRSLDTSPLTMPSTYSSQLTPWSSQWHPTAAWRGRDFVVGYVADGGDAVALQFVTPEGVVSGERVFDRETGICSIETAGSGATVWGAWADPYKGLFATRLDGAPTPIVRVTQSANRQIAPRTASDGDQYLILWQDYREPPYLGIQYRPSLYAARIGRDGRVLDDPALPVGRGGATADVAFDGNAFVVVTAPQVSLPTVSGFRLARDGTPLAPVPAFSFSALVPAAEGGVDQIPVQVSDPRIASTGIGSLAVWAWSANGPEEIALRLDAEARPVGDPIVLAASTAPPHVAAGAGRYLVVYNGAVNQAHGVLVDAAGVTPIAPFAAGSIADIAGGDAGFLVLSLDGGALRAALLSTDGTVVRTDLTLPQGGVSTGAPRVAWDGTSFVVGTVEGTDGDFHVTRVWPDGTVARGLYVATAGTQTRDAPALASDGAGNTLITYSRFDPAPPFGERRVRNRLLTTAVVASDAGGSGSTDAGAVSLSDSSAPAASSPADAAALAAAGAPDGGTRSRDARADAGALPDAAQPAAPQPAIASDPGPRPSRPPSAEPHGAALSASGGCACSLGPTNARRDSLDAMLVLFLAGLATAGRRGRRHLSQPRKALRWSERLDSTDPFPAGG